MLHSVCTSTSSRPAYRLQHKCNIWVALNALPLALRRYYELPKRLRHSLPFSLADLITRLQQPEYPLLPDAGLVALPPLPYQSNSQE